MGFFNRRHLSAFRGLASSLSLSTGAVEHFSERLVTQ